MTTAGTHDSTPQGVAADEMKSRSPNRVSSLKSILTWGTADETVLINNKGRQFKSEAGGGLGHIPSSSAAATAMASDHGGGSHDNMDVFQKSMNKTTTTGSSAATDQDQQQYQQQQVLQTGTPVFNTQMSAPHSPKFNGAVLKSHMSRSISHGSQGSTNVNKSNEKNEDGNLSSLFNYIFCLGGTEGAILEEREASSNVKRGNNTAYSSSNPRNSINTKKKTTTTTKKQSQKESDALILEMALQQSRNHTTTRRAQTKYNSNRVAPSDKLGSLDIVMELQQQEKETTRIHTNGKSPKSSRKSKGMNVQNDSDTALAAIEDQSVVTDIFDFGGTNHSTSLSSNKGLSIQGPALGTFLNVSSEEIAMHPEVVNTYFTYRCDKKSVSLVLSRVTCSVPLYHHHGSEMERESTLQPEMSLSSSQSSSTDNEGTKVHITSKIKNVCSEPVSKIFDVRGPTYLSNGKKVSSDETIFALLGVDNFFLKKGDSNYRDRDVCKSSDSFFSRLRIASERLRLMAPFLIVVNFVVPWGNVLGYFYRPDGDFGRPYNASRKNVPSENLWDRFMAGDENFRNRVLKFIPRVVEGPWALKKLVGTQPAMIGQKIPTSYFGSLDDGYLEICIDVTKGGKMANHICSAVASKASMVSIDLAFLLQGENEQELPEQLLSVMRLHHVRLKKSKQI